MSETIVGNAITNTKNGSVVQVSVDYLVASINIMKNDFMDELPIIPIDARIKDGKILYSLILRVKLVRHADGKAVAGYELSIKSNRKFDKFTSQGKTNQNGESLFFMETRDSGSLEIETATEGVVLPLFKINLKDAWYQTPFLITGYHVCDEGDFSGSLVDGKGLREKHKEDFLFGARGVPMQGTGKSADGRYIALDGKSTKWHLNSRGAPDHVMSQDATSFRYVDSVEGKYGPVTENHSIAVDPTVIHPHAVVEIDGVGRRFADDRGGGIKGYHIDNFLGAGDLVVKEWMSGNINGKKCKVKYIGGKS